MGTLYIQLYIYTYIQVKKKRIGRRNCCEIKLKEKRKKYVGEWKRMRVKGLSLGDIIATHSFLLFLFTRDYTIDVVRGHARIPISLSNVLDMHE